MISTLFAENYHTESPPVVCPDGRFSIDCGGTLVQVISPSEPWRDAAEARYGAFVCREGAPEVVIHHSEDEAALIAEFGYSAHVDATGRKARIGALEGTDLLDGVLRTILPSVMAPDLIAHGALLVGDSRAFLCCGISGSGKSTMAALFPDLAACDELARLHVDDRGVEVRSLPFWKARPLTTSLTAVFILEHGVQHRRIRLDEAEALRELKKHVYWPLEDSQLVDSSFETLAAWCRRTPVFRLAFRPDPSVWATMAEGL